MEESTPVQAAARYRKVIEDYKSRLKNNPDLKFSEYCKASNTNYHRVMDWTKRHGISILELRPWYGGISGRFFPAHHSVRTFGGILAEFFPSCRPAGARIGGRQG